MAYCLYFIHCSILVVVMLLWCMKVNLQANRAMVTAHLLVHDARLHKLDVLWCVWFKLALADQKVVQPPAAVGLP